jgi:hypothetical protein
MRTLVLILFLILFSYKNSTNAQTTITIDSTVQTSTCDGAQIVIWFKTTGSFAVGNRFKAQLISGFSFPPFINPAVIDIGESAGISLPPPFGDGVTKTVIGTVPEGAAPGLYYARLISSNPFDTSANSTTPIVLTQNAQTATPAIETKCENGNTILTITPQANGYAWSTGDTTQSTRVSVGGDYTVITSDILGCTTETSITLPQNIIKSECVGESTMLTSTLTATSYVWSTGQQGSSITVNDTSSNKTGVIYYVETSNPFSCASAPIVYNSQCAIFDIDIYPNPSKGIVNIRISRDFDTVRINVMNSLGQIVYSEIDKKTTPYYTTQINLQGLGRGIYFIQLDTGKNKRTRKLLLNY